MVNSEVWKEFVRAHEGGGQVEMNGNHQAVRTTRYELNGALGALVIAVLASAIGAIVLGALAAGAVWAYRGVCGWLGC